MKEDYLWDKAGSDAEIERLENALAVFRCRETAAPILPAANQAPPIKAINKSRSIKVFRFAALLAAGLIVALTAFGAWIQMRRGNFEIKTDLAEKTLRQIEDSANQLSPLVEPHKLVFNTVDNAVRSAPPESAKERKITAAPIVKALKAPARKRDAGAPPKSGLTKEEKYAYDQLMLALTITSEKLKIVKDKAAGNEAETEDFAEKGR